MPYFPRVAMTDLQRFGFLLLAMPVITPALAGAQALPRVSTGHSPDDAGFRLDPVPPPAINDLAAGVLFKVVSGRVDPNSGPVEVLTDGAVPGGNDEPRSNFFFANSREPSRLSLDLGKPVPLHRVASYTWHSGSRAAQQFRLYAADGSEESFAASPDAKVSPVEVGWTFLAEVDTSGKRGGQHAAEIIGQDGAPLGTFRHLLFEISANHDPSGFGNTFFSEIDVIAAEGPEPIRFNPPEKIVMDFEGEGIRITLDSTASPDLLPWFRDTAIPAMLEWYPKIMKQIAIPDQTPPAPEAFRIELREGQIMPGRDGIPGFASGDRIVVSSKFMRDQMRGEALGCLIHEMVHIIQFGAGQRAHRSVPSWFYEGATDYIRWFLFEPEKNGAAIRNPSRVRHNDSYRVTANFMDWVIRNHCEDLLAKAHIAIHKGYSDDLWETWTGKSVAKLEEEWKSDLTK
jgi:hypothetical protein